MSKIVTLLLGPCLVLIATSSNSLAQNLIATPPPENMAAVEATRRQAMTMELQLRLTEGDTAFEKGDFATAARVYEDALLLAKQIGGGVEANRRRALDGMVASRMRLAEQAMRRADFAEADAQLARILKEDPRNQAAIDLREENTKRRAREEGRRPDEATIAMLPAAHSNNVYAATLVQNGKLLYEAGRLDEAQEQLVKAFRIDRANRGAIYYLELIREQKHKQELARREFWSKEKLVQIDRAWSDPVKRDLLPSPNPMARTNLIYTSRERQGIYSKLQRIRLDQLRFDGLPLSEVVKQLGEEARRRDPDRQGINIIVSPNVEPLPPPPPAAIDPATGLPTAPAVPVEQIDLAGTIIKIDPPLVGLTLQQALEAITKVADRPIKYSVEDYAIVFSPRIVEAVPLHTRQFRVDPNLFVQGLQGVSVLSFGTSGGGGQGGGGGGGFGGGGGGGSRGGGGGGRGGGGGGGGQGGQDGLGVGGSEYVGVTVSGLPNILRTNLFGANQGGGNQQFQAGEGLRSVTIESPQSQMIFVVNEFFRASGVDLSQPVGSGKGLFFNDRLGVLIVRATLGELDIIEQAIQVLNMAPPQVTIEAKFAEVTQDDTRALGFDWFLGNTLISHGRMGLQGGTAPSYVGRSTAANPGGPTAGLPPGNNIFPGPSGIIGAGVIPPSATDNFLTPGLRNSAPAVATLSGILTDPQFRMVVRALEQRSGVDLLTAPTVTTLSSRQTQIKVVDVKYIVTDLGIGQTASGGSLGGGVTGGGGGAGVVGGFIQPITEPIELGPVLDVVPYVSADGHTIQMTIIPTIKEFVGYDLETAALFAAQVQSVSGTAASAPLTTTTPLPQFRLRQVVTSAIVWDGQTVVLGGLIAENVAKTKDKIPILGDVPVLGRFFRSESFSTRKKNLLIFVTPTIIDPAGNRVNTDEELPFAQTTIPPQAPFAPVAR